MIQRLHAVIFGDKSAPCGLSAPSTAAYDASRLTGCPRGVGQALSNGDIAVSAGGVDLRCRSLINCAGLSAVALAGQVKGSKADSVPEAFFAKGSYFQYTGEPNHAPPSAR